ncbi:hypothetical protein OUZ56_032155 [Daphnia magna]|uniref:Retrotransposon gag domain-containing protein n=1 Tax=Daphnia magna TaxID=35525 RepID=A0ABQ9ZWD9_9CRUS|nr:hypothetical protein OUZ56_032155 [Daphnia magna]
MQKKICPVLEKFAAHFESRRDECFKRFKFLLRHQTPGESCETWLVDLRKNVKFSREASQAQLMQMRAAEPPGKDSVHGLQDGSPKSNGGRQASHGTSSKKPQSDHFPSARRENFSIPLDDVVRPTRSATTAARKDIFLSKKVQILFQEECEPETSDPQGEFSINEIFSGSSVDEWIEAFQIEGKKMDVKLDCGATCNVLLKELFIRIPHQRRHLRLGPKVYSYGASGGYLTVLGMQTCKVVQYPPLVSER